MKDEKTYEVTGYVPIRGYLKVRARRLSYETTNSPEALKRALLNEARLILDEMSEMLDDYPDEDLLNYRLGAQKEISGVHVQGQDEQEEEDLL